jgi:hypothetical protein
MSVAGCASDMTGARRCSADERSGIRDYVRRISLRF